MNSDKQALIEWLDEKIPLLDLAVEQTALEKLRPHLEKELECRRIALAALTAEPYCWHDGSDMLNEECWDSERSPRHPVPVYSNPPASTPAIPEGWKLVPVVPTEKMVIEGFESDPDEAFCEPEEWEKYSQMSGCQQAAQKARLCWEAMLAAAPAPGGS